MMKPELITLKQYAKGAAEILRSGFGKEHQVVYKGAIDLVTEIDRRSEDFLLANIQRDFPGHMIFTEESGQHQGSLDHCWYIDPLDGTVNYAHGVPIFSISIAYAENGRVLLGVVYDPMQDECFAAERGKGAWLNDELIQVSEADELVKSLLVTGFPYDIRTAKENNLNYFGYFATHAQAVRRLGSAALDLSYVASGRFDGYWELRLNAWDVAAGALICEEAGGLVTDLEGNKDYLKDPYAMVAANPHVHAQLLEGIRLAGNGRPAKV
jgi:myo-inositol-1(or 4)-monophosphatase